MRIYNKIPEKSGVFNNPVITIGSFDGVHSGHRRILKSLLNIARQKSGEAVVFTFNENPRVILSPNNPPGILTTTKEKIQAIEDFGVNNIILIEFTKEMANMEADEFFKDIILKKIGIIDIVVGYDHTFGKNRKGDISFLREYSKKRGFGVTQVLPKNLYSRPISSTWIRKEVENGNIAFANILLGRNYTLLGRVVRGEGRGRLLGFPTANVSWDNANKIIPGDGVYAVTVKVENSIKNYGMLNIGKNPTFSNNVRTIEVNIFDFNEDIYDTEIEIKFQDKIRDEVKFNSPDELIEQIKMDKIRALKILDEGQG